MKKLLLLILVASALICKSQNYSYQSIPYQDNTVHNTYATYPTDDYYSNVIPIGFNFKFYGRNYSSLLICTDGFITFDLTKANTHSDYDLTNKTVNDLCPKSIYLTYQDIDINFGGSISYSIIGTAPNRQFIVSYDNIPYYESDNQFSTCAQTNHYTGYLSLYETTNAIELYIKNKDFCIDSGSFTGWNEGLALAGIHDTGSASLILPNRGLDTVWSVINEAWRFCPNGQCQNNNSSALNLIKGKVYADINQNCIFDSELPAANTIIKLDSFFINTDNEGNFVLHADTGQHTLSIITKNFKNCNGDSSVTIYFPTYGDSSVHNDFMDTILGTICSKNFINVGTSRLLACANNQYLAIRYGNNGMYREDSLDITVTLNDSLQVSSSSIPYTNIGNNKYLFHITTPLYSQQTNTLKLYVTTGCDPVGTAYCYSASIRSFNSTCILGNDTISYECTNLLASFDPNVKLVGYQDYEHKGYTTYEEIDSTNSLLYKICFQNTGNAPAQTVILRDTLANYLDPSSIKFIASSHTYSFDVTGQVLTITYNDINLVDSSVSQTESTGWVRFSINQIAGNTEGTTINNRAGIYFDSNPVVTTNTVTNLIPASVVLALDNLNNQDISVLVYPNPFSEDALLTVKGEKGINNLHLTIYDMVGRVVNNYQSASNSLIINRKGLSAGVYFYSVTINNELTKTGLLKVF